MDRTLFDDISQSSLIKYDGLLVDSFDLATCVLVLRDLYSDSSSILYQSLLNTIYTRIDNMTTSHQRCLQWSIDWLSDEERRKIQRRKALSKRESLRRIQEEREFNKYLEAKEDDGFDMDVLLD